MCFVVAAFDVFRVVFVVWCREHCLFLVDLEFCDGGVHSLLRASGGRWTLNAANDGAAGWLTAHCCQCHLF